VLPRLINVSGEPDLINEMNGITRSMYSLNSASLTANKFRRQRKAYTVCIYFILGTGARDYAFVFQIE
jgi:hypothetical protein